MPDNPRSEDAWLPDDPIKNDAQDTLGRGAFALRVAGILDDAAAIPSSVVVGLTGPWGSGKSSTVNLAISHLDTKRWAVREVNPWGLAGAEAVITEVLAAIASALPSRATKAVKAVSKYAALASPLLSAIPFGDIAGTAVDLAAQRLAGDTTLAGQSGEVSKALIKLKQPMLVVIDDMDRLQPPELLALFKAVRLLGRLPYVHYLLSYDQRTVLELISATPIAAGDEDRAAAFMEKIITIRLDQPPTRVEQSQSMYDARLRDLLTHLHVTNLTMAMQQRLETEHRPLLRRALAEPRAVSRFFTQLYAYLPMLGIENVDLPDFIAMTLLRLQFPRLYTALSSDRGVLVGTDAVEWENPLGSWRDLPAKLTELTDGDALRESLVETLGLLFPSLPTAYTSSSGTRADRKRGRRVSDEDYVDRYFALMLPDDDVSDVHISGALTEWARDAPADHAERLRAALLPANQNVATYAATDRILRRCQAESSTLTRKVCGTVTVYVAGLLRVLPQPNLAAAQDWLTELMVQSGDIPFDALVAKVDAPVEQTSALWPLTRAMSRAASALRDQDTTDLDALARDTNRLAEIVLTRFLDQLALRDAAPAEPALGFLMYAEDVLGRDTTDARLQQAINDGQIRIIDLAARLVNIGNYLNDYRQFITEFDPADLTSRVGTAHLGNAGPEVNEATAEAGDDVLNVYDISWANLRRYAGRQILHQQLIPTFVTDPLPQAPDRIINEVTNRDAPIITAAGRPDLQFTITIWGPKSVAATEPLPSGQFDSATQDWMSQLPLLGVTSWLASKATLWHGEPQPWAPTDSNVGRMQQAQAILAQHNDPSAAPGSESTPTQMSAAAAARVLFRPHPSDGGPSLTRLVSIEAGFWLAMLDAEHRPVTENTNVHPYPAARTLAAARELICTLVRDAMNPQLWPVDWRHTGSDLVLVATAATTSGLDGVLNLAHLRRDAPRSSGQADLVVETPAHNTYSDRHYRKVVDPDRVAVTLLSRWLGDNAYRAFDNEFLE